MSMFYHNFPRPRRDLNPKIQIEMGIAILTSILDSGFLLTPELVEWRKKSTHALSLESYAQRMCFTLLDESELSAHSSLFGRFAIVLEPDALQMLGGLPVIYLPSAPSPIEGLSGLGTDYLEKLAEIERFLRGVTSTENVVRKAKGHSRTLRFRMLDVGVDKDIDCETKNAEALLDCWTKQNNISNPAELYAAFTSFVELVYPAGSNQRLNVGELGYYRQREWRICGRLTRNSTPLFRPLTSEEKARLIAIDAEFFEKPLQFLSNEETVVDRSSMFSEIDGRKVSSFIKEVIVPFEVTDEVKDITARNGLTIQVKPSKNKS